MDKSEIAYFSYCTVTNYSKNIEKIKTIFRIQSLITCKFYGNNTTKQFFTNENICHYIMFFITNLIVTKNSSQHGH